MKKIFFLSIIFILLTSCSTDTGLPTSEPTRGSTLSPTQSTQPSLIPTVQATSTVEPLMFKVAEFGRGYIFNHALSPDGRTMAIASSSGLYLYDMETQEIARYIKSEREDIEEVAFSSNGRYLAYHGKKARVLDLMTNKVILETEDSFLSDQIDISPDNRFLAYLTLTMADRSGWCVSSIEIWDIKEAKKIFSQEPPQDLSYDYDLPCPILRKFSFNQDGSVIFAGYGGGLVAWEISSKKQLFYSPAYSGVIRDMFYDPENDLVVTADSGGAIRYWNGKTGENIKTLGVTGEDITSITLSNEKQLSVETNNQMTSIVDYKTGKLIRRTTNESKDQEYAELKNKLYNDGFFALNEFESFQGDYMRIKKIAFSGDGTKIATNCAIIDAQTGKTLFILPSCDPEYKDSKYREWQLVYGRTGKYLAEGSSRGELKLWNVLTGELTMDKQELGYITAMAISENESLLAVGTKYVSLWDTENTRVIKNFYPGTGRVEYAGFRDNDQKLITVTVPDYLVSIFDITTGKLLSLIRPPLPVTSTNGNVYFLGNKMVAEGAVWEITEDSAEVLLSGTFNYSQPPAVSPNERILVVQNDQFLNFWDIKARKIIYTFDASYMSINPKFSPDGNHIAFIGTGGTIQVWDISHIVELASP